MDKTAVPIFRTFGRVVHYVRKQWRPMCFNSPQENQMLTATKICHSLGFLNFENITSSRIVDKPLSVQMYKSKRVPYIFFLHNITPSWDPSRERHAIEAREARAPWYKNCTSLTVTCTNVTIGTGYGKFGPSENRQVPPWIAAIYIDGIFRCTGVLITTEWILTSKMCLPYRFE